VLTLDQSVATATSSTLHEACRLGDADETQRLLDAGTNINARDQVLIYLIHFVDALYIDMTVQNLITTRTPKQEQEQRS